MKQLRIAVAAALIAAITACGGVKNTVRTEPSNISAMKQLTLAPVQVTSTEQNEDAHKYNGQLQRLAKSEIEAMLAAKGIHVPGSQGTIECAIDVTYGSRAKRYWLGFGAGAGHVHVLLSLKDAKGAVRYSTQSDADLSFGVWGGDMSEVAQKAIRAAVETFGSRL